MKNKLILDLSLGDGYLAKPRSENGNSHLRMHHSIKQKEYVLYKKTLLEKAGFRAIYRETKVKHYDTCYIMTGKLPEITEIRNFLYQDGKKTLSKEVIDLLDERSISILFQDDGCGSVIKKESKKLKSGLVYYDVKPYIHQFSIATNDFDGASVEKLAEKLSSWGLVVKIYDRKGPTIVISTIESKKKFVDIVKPYMCESMKYKISGEVCNHGRI